MKPTEQKPFDLHKKYPKGKEKDLKKEVRRLLDHHRAHWKMSVPVGYGKNGVDFDVCFRGSYLAIETKAGDNKPTKQQIEYMADVVKAGGNAIVAYCLLDIELGLEIIAEGKQYYSEELEPWIEE